jgi:NAD(P)-dependent dehydrogenase (short-subunit alcohol dehydrogenase family)
MGKKMKFFDLEGKTMIVTGGSSGIGKAISCAAAASGAAVAVADINVTAAGELVRELEEAGLKAGVFKVDVSDSFSVGQLMNQVLDRYGSLDVVVNNAGILGDAEITAIDDEKWRRLMAVDLDGVFYCCREAVRIMKERHSGRIVNIASAGGKLGFPFAGVHYCAAKGAVMALTRQLAMQTGKYGIQVNAVAPGTTQTEMVKQRTPETLGYINSHIPLGRMGRPEETAAAVVFLASDAAGFITGETLDVNGGLYMA